MQNLDIRNCKATVAADKTYILEQIERTIKVDNFNRMMQDALKRGVEEVSVSLALTRRALSSQPSSQVLLIMAVQKNDLDSAINMIRAGAKVLEVLRTECVLSVLTIKPRLPLR